MKLKKKCQTTGMFLICIINCIGESGPGCSAHAQGCDGSTGTQKK